MTHHTTNFARSRLQQQQQKPAKRSNKASGWYVIGRYKTACGIVGVEIRVDATSGELSYVGTWGTGAGLSRESMRSSLRFMLRGHRGAVEEIPFGGVEVSA